MLGETQLVTSLHHLRFFPQPHWHHVLGSFFVAKLDITYLLIWHRSFCNNDFVRAHYQPWSSSWSPSTLSLPLSSMWLLFNFLFLLLNLTASCPLWPIFPKNTSFELNDLKRHCEIPCPWVLHSVLSRLINSSLECWLWDSPGLASDHVTRSPDPCQAFPEGPLAEQARARVTAIR